MTPLIDGFKQCAHQAGGICGCTIGKLIRAFGLGDFLENALQENDDAPTIAVKALSFFCDEGNPHSQKFQFAVLAVGLFLNHYHANQGRDVPQQALRDLGGILTKTPREEQLRRWIDSHFGSGVCNAPRHRKTCLRHRLCRRFQFQIGGQVAWQTHLLIVLAVICD
jgi:hypothetical protein